MVRRRVSDDEAQRTVVEVASVKGQVQAIIRRLRAGLDELESVLPLGKGESVVGMESHSAEEVEKP